MSLYKSVEKAPDDPILSLVEQYNQDTRPEKVNLSIGIYTDANGKVPILKAVNEAQDYFLKEQKPHVYLPMHGLNSYIDAVKRLIFSEHSSVLTENRLATVQTLGGTGALKVGADFLHQLLTDEGVSVYVSNPTWDNHRAIFKGAGFEVKDYPYFDAKTGGVDFDALLAFVKTLKKHSILVLHACCHNPTGADLSEDEWQKLAEAMKTHELIPFLDMAYQGFSKGVDEDARAIHIFEKAGLPALIANSFSKSFSLYGERVGALSVITGSADEQVRVTSQLKKMVRANYSSPPIYGAALVGHVLNDPRLKQLWLDELREMRERIHVMRDKFVALLNEGQTKRDFSFIRAQNGMFSYSGLTKAEVDRLREEFAIYAVGTGRICVAALNEHNVVKAAEAIIKVI